MGKLGACWSSALYSIKKQYPMIHEFERRLETVENELNKGAKEEKRNCNHCCNYKPKRNCDYICNNRQKRQAFSLYLSKKYGTIAMII